MYPNIIIGSYLVSEDSEGIKIIWRFPDMGVPQIIYFNDCFHFFNHPFWGIPMYGNPIYLIQGELVSWVQQPPWILSKCGNVRSEGMD